LGSPEKPEAASGFLFSGRSQLDFLGKKTSGIAPKV